MGKYENGIWVDKNTGSRETMKITAALCGAIFITMLLVSCIKQEAQTSGAQSAGIEGIHWYLTELGSAPISPLAGDKQPHMLLDPLEKQATGFAGCNNFFGRYDRDGSSFTFGPLGATRMACPDLETGLESTFFEALKSTRNWKKADGELLLLDGNQVLARFSPEKYMGIIGPVWQWTQTLYNDDRTVVPADPENYTVQFQEDGTISVKADCNVKGGTYSIPRGEKTIFIEITQSTIAACPEGSLEDEFVKGLSAATIYFIQNGDLCLDLKYDSGTMQFSKQNES